MSNVDDYDKAKEVWVTILKNTPPTERKSTMYQATKQILDEANQDVEELRRELEEKLKKPKTKQVTEDEVETKITPMKMWVDREKGVTAEEFIKTNWEVYIKAGLVTRGILREFDPSFYRYLQKNKLGILEKISTVGDISVQEITQLKELDFSPQDLSRLYSINYRK
jgi:hypothetical protein